MDKSKGAGKTYTSLILASALTCAASPITAHKGKIAFLNIERRSAKLCANLFNFDVAELNYFNPLNYVKVINAAEGSWIE